MPTQKANDTLARQWELLNCLPDRPPGLSARALRQRLADAGFDVTKRTVERDLERLSAVFPLQCDDEALPYRWHWMPQTHLHLPALALAEALSLTLLEHYLRPLLPASLLRALEPQFQHARKKLGDTRQSNRYAEWMDKVRSVPATLNLQPPDIDPARLETLQQALLEEHQIEARYHATGGERQLRLHPLALVQAGPVTYLLATAWDYEDVRLYAVHRFVEVERLDQPARRPPDFNLDTLLRDGTLPFTDSGERLRLHARVSDTLARILRETPLAPDQHLAPEGEHWRLEVELPDTWQLEWWLLAQGEHLTVLEPPALRERIARRLRDALAGYE